MNNLLIGKGFLGEKIIKIFKEKNVKIINTTLNKNESKLNLDITNKNKCFEIIEKIKPDNILLPASITGVDYCEKNKEEAYNVNVEGTANIVNALIEKSPKTKLIFYSTDYVFDGKKGNYSEKDKTNPINIYGKTKLEGEKIIQKNLENYLILRVSSLYGFNSNKDKNTFTSFALERIKKNEQIPVTTQTTNPTLINDISLATFSLIEKNAKGIFHVVGKNSFTRKDWVLLITKTFNFKTPKLKEINEIPNQIAKRPFNTSLNIRKLESQGISMLNGEQGLKEMKKDIETVPII